MDDSALLSTARGLYFEELDEGASYLTGSATMTEEDIKDFARRWDPQPFHLDPHAAAASIFGSLVASGLHTLAQSLRLQVDSGLVRRTALAGLGIERMRFWRPVRVGDTLQVRMTIGKKEASSAPDRGKLLLRLETENQHAQRVLSFDLLMLVQRRIGS